MKGICYFDNAATTYPKPLEVVREVERCMSEYCGNPGRGSHRMALASAEVLYRAREEAAKLFSCSVSDGVVFTLNATYALNMAINGLIKQDSHVLISDLEHNSVLRPVENLKRHKGVTYSVFKTEGNVLENIRRVIRPDTKAVICTHGSNVTNRILPIEKIGRMASLRGMTFIVDASQTAGAHRIDMERCGISAICMPGHKGLLGVQGVGMAIFSPDEKPEPFVYGGSGSSSREADMPGVLPDRLEGGTMPTPAIAGLLAGMQYVGKEGSYSIYKRECDLMGRIKRHFAGDERLVTYSRGDGPVWLFCVKGESSQRTAMKLDALGVCVRPGLHCAPLAHKTLGTPEDGAVRASAGPLTSEKDAEDFVYAMEHVLSKK